MGRLKRLLFAMFAVTLVVFSFPVQQVQAQSFDDIMKQGIIFAGICTEARVTGANDPCDCRGRGDCSLDDMMQVVVNISVFILGISGSVALLVFVYGGFMWLTAAGSADRVEKGKQAFIAGVVGLVIIFGAYAAITAFISVLKTGEIPGEGDTLESVTAQPGTPPQSPSASSP